MATVRSRVFRILRPLRDFEEKDLEQAVSAAGFHPRREESVLGIYRNTPDSLKGSFFVTDKGIWAKGLADWELIEYGDIARVEHSHDKCAIKELTLHRRFGEPIAIQVSGGKAQTRDAWEVLRFLDRVREDLGGE